MAKGRSTIVVKIGGSAVAEAFANALVQVTVESNLHMPAMFAIEVYDDKQEYVDSATYDLGKPVEISITPEDATSATSLISGAEITSIEPHFSETSRTTLLIRGYDKSHRLLRGKKTRTFAKVSDSDLASKVGQECGLTVQVDAISTKLDYVIQNNQSNMEFLLERARRNGYNLFASEGKLYFKKGSYTLGSGPTINWGEDLISFRPRMSGVQQTDKSIITGWDSATQKAVTGEATAAAPANQAGISKAGGAAAKTAFGGAAEAVIASSPVTVAGVATAMATGLMEDISADFVQAEGECFGDPTIQAGKTITIGEVGTRFGGKYLVTSATHVYRAGRYMTHFVTGGHEPYTMSHLLGGGNGRSEPGWHTVAPGVVVGVVTNQKDPDNLGRVKVKFPWMNKADGVEIESDWVRIASPMAGDKRGLMFMPEINDEVLLAFEHGDAHAPYVLGSLWSSKFKPPLPNSDAAKNGKVEQRIIKSRVGHVILLDDTQNAEKIIIRDKSEKNEIIIDTNAKALTINIEKDVSITAGGNLTLKSTGDMVFDAKNVTVKAQQNIAMKATQNAEIKATSNVTLEATSQLSLKGTAGAKLANAVASIALSGPSVNINNGALEVI